jgi:hypothetical protein
MQYLCVCRCVCVHYNLQCCFTDFTDGSEYSRCCKIGEYTTAISEQWLGNHVPAETNTHATIERPFLCNGEVNMPLRQLNYCYRWCFLFCPCKVVIKRRVKFGSSVELNKGGWEIQLRVESPAVKKRVSCKSAAVKRRLDICCSYKGLL